MTSPKITVVIPTRERLATLRYSIKTVLCQSYEYLQIVVSDNYSNDGTEDFVRGLCDSRVQYVNPGRRLSMSEHWEYALSHVPDGWVIFLGDDDGVLPEAITKLATIIQSTDCEAITFRTCGYIWPYEGYAGQLRVPLSRGREIRDSSKWLKRVMNLDDAYYNLPAIYVWGMVNMALINRARRQDQRFFNSCVPDVYACIALARSTPKYLYLKEPFTIVGTSKFSIGAQWIRRGNLPEIGKELDFASEGKIPFHPDVPLRPDGGLPLSLQALVFEAYLQSSFLQPHSDGPRLEKQLALALARPETTDLCDASSPYEARNQQWCRDFAHQHGLDFDAALAHSRRLRRAAKLKNWAHRLQSLFGKIIVYDRAVSLPNVFVASIFAASLLWIRPSISTRLRKTFWRILARANNKPLQSVTGAKLSPSIPGQ